MISGWLDDCLAIHTKAGWEALASKIAALPITDMESRRFQRFVFSNATEAQMDKQGRVLLPAHLRESVGLTDEAVLVGTQDHAEIWAPDRWDAYRKTLEDPQELAKAFAGLGI
jgi:MraZ protein